MYVCNFPNVEQYLAFCKEKYKADKTGSHYSSNFVRLNNTNKNTQLSMAE